MLRFLYYVVQVLDMGCDEMEGGLVRQWSRDRIFRLACVAYTYETSKFLMLRPKIPQSRRV
jgi:hypothetical protein